MFDAYEVNRVGSKWGVFGHYPDGGVDLLVEFKTKTTAIAFASKFPIIIYVYDTQGALQSIINN